MCGSCSHTVQVYVMHGIRDDTKCRQNGGVGPRQVETDRHTGALTPLHGKEKNYPSCDPEQGVPQGCQERQRDTETQMQRENGVQGMFPERQQYRQREAKVCMVS